MALRSVSIGKREQLPQGPSEAAGWDLLTRAVEAALFNAAAIAPPDGLVERAIALLALLPLEEVEDEQLLQMWEAQVAAGAQSFALAPEEWSGIFVHGFMSRCAATFGVEDRLVPKLVRAFHDESKWARLGVLAAVQRCPLFSYVHREILAMPEEDDMDIEDPTTALRSLLSEVFADE